MCGNLNEHRWFPPGRYVYKQYHQDVVRIILHELGEQKESFEWIQKGLFSNYVEMKDHYTYFEEWLKKVRAI